MVKKTETAKNTKNVVEEQIQLPQTAIVYKEVNLEQITPNPYNPRKSFNEEELNELATSIRLYGVLQPILVRPKGEQFEIVYGERRWRASKIAGKEAIPAQIKSIEDDLAENMALVENIQRVDINVYDQAFAMDRLLKKGCNIAELTAKTGLSEKVVRTRLNILKLIPEVVELLQKEDILLSNALELCKYDEQVQQRVYEEKLADENDIRTWRRIKSKEFAENLRARYMTKLSHYHFDKTQCETCFENSANHILFTDCTNCQSCNNRNCISKKNSAFLVDKVIRLSQEMPDAIIEAHLNSDKEVIETLSNSGYKITQMGWRYDYNEFPVPPKQPTKEEFDDAQEYEDAMIQYEEATEEYQSETAFFENAISKNTYTTCLVVDALDVHILYKEKEQEEEEDNEEEDDTIEVLDEETGELITKSISATAPMPEKNPLEKEREEKIQKQIDQNKRNWEICNEKIIDECKKIATNTSFNTELPIKPLEEKMLYYLLLTYIDETNRPLFNLEQRFPSEKDKVKILENLTQKQKNTLIRLFINKTLREHAYNLDMSSLLFREFIGMHNAKKAETATTTYKQIFDKRRDNIIARLRDFGSSAKVEHYQFKTYEDLVAAYIEPKLSPNELDEMSASILDADNNPFLEDEIIETESPQEEQEQEQWIEVEPDEENRSVEISIAA